MLNYSMNNKFDTLDFEAKLKTLFCCAVKDGKFVSAANWNAFASVHC